MASLLVDSLSHFRRLGTSFPGEVRVSVHRSCCKLRGRSGTRRQVARGQNEREWVFNGRSKSAGRALSLFEEGIPSNTNRAMIPRVSPFVGEIHVDGTTLFSTLSIPGRAAAWAFYSPSPAVSCQNEWVIPSEFRSKSAFPVKLTSILPNTLLSPLFSMHR